ncbi:hypothetical protein K457DRAFT_1406589 [Linnemannia elongata AG-77]|uniref:Uncharacterized protein n=1 Tax=Linnemannia elongata AG-77 TaxID=1314771 RepID=A0A197JT07_9FUNG|nr:hypothetical protein K457DRAFT_1406589 [Linnemannia elongata AG-77]
MQVMLGYRWLPFSIARLLSLRQYGVASNFLSHDSALMSSLLPLSSSYSFHSPSSFLNAARSTIASSLTIPIHTPSRSSTTTRVCFTNTIPFFQSPPTRPSHPASAITPKPPPN